MLNVIGGHGMGTEQWSITELVKVTREEMLTTRFTPLSLALPERVWGNLEEYMRCKEIVEFSKEVGMAFLEERYHFSSDPTSHSNQDRLRAIELLADFQRHERIMIRRRRRSDEIAEPLRSCFQTFIDYRKATGISPKTLESNLIYLKRFSEYLVAHSVGSVDEIDIVDIHGFLQFTAATYRTPTVYCTSCLLRVLFQYLYDKQIIVRNLSLQVPAVKCSKKSKVPSAYTQEEVHRLLASVDRGNPKGKRDYAMLLIAIRLGIRASDICRLTFDNFKWESNIIELQQEKTDKPLVLPLLNDVGEAVIDYIKYGRPAVDIQVVFLRLSAPIEPIQAPTLHSIVTHYMNQAKIQIPEGKKHGPHALRHSLASALLHNDTPMPVISEILGHTDTESTSVYLKIDTLHLRDYALDVPAIDSVWWGGAFA